VIFIERKKMRLKQKHIKILRDVRNNRHDYCINFKCFVMYVDARLLSLDSNGTQEEEEEGINGRHV
jgi:hypothetical protein